MPGADGGLAGRVLADLWSAAGVLAEPALRLVLRRRARLGKEIAERLSERRGIERTLRPAGPLLWMHAASVGETISVLPVLHALAHAAPELRLLLTTGTVTSATIAAERLPEGALHRFVPLDVPRWIARFLDHWRPDAACFVESEIWPNILAAANARRIPLALLDARLSNASFAHWRRVAPLARRLFGGFAVIWARSQADAGRLSVLSGRPVSAPGDLKFAAAPLPFDPEVLAGLLNSMVGRPIWTAASVHPGEDAMVVEAHRRLAALHPGLVTVIVPRHPSRAAAMVAACPMPRRSLGMKAPQGGLYMADTLGELGLFYRAGCCAFVGGSLVPHGGQNPLEPARLGRAVAIGPHAENFAEACAALRAAGGLTDIGDVDGLVGWADRMLRDPAAAAARGAAAQTAARRWADLPDRIAQALLGLIGGSA